MGLIGKWLSWGRTPAGDEKEEEKGRYEERRRRSGDWMNERNSVNSLILEI